MDNQTIGLLHTQIAAAFDKSMTLEYDFDPITQKERVANWQFDLHDFLAEIDEFSWELKRSLIIRLLTHDSKAPRTLRDKLSSIVGGSMAVIHNKGGNLG
jgi:hypothetical protein